MCRKYFGFYYAELLSVILELCCNSGAPSPLVIISDPFGTSSYEFEVSWEKPETGGMPIVEYRFQLRKVNSYNYVVLSYYSVKPGCQIFIETWNFMQATLHYSVKYIHSVSKNGARILCLITLANVDRF